MPSSKSKLKPKIQFKVSNKKLSQALRKLTKPSQITQKQETLPSCKTNIIKLLNTNAYAQPIEWRQNWLEVFQTSISRHNWETFIRALRLASQSKTFCGLDNIIRNSFLSILTHQIYKDEKALRLYLYTIAPCRNEQDIEFCIETILRTFNGEQNKTIEKAKTNYRQQNTTNSEVIKS
uniref:Uncharacterized protein n=1 Tax=Anopheles christyi TaxID=43041 RepID=A0A182JVD3_9DIPT